MAENENRGDQDNENVLIAQKLGALTIQFSRLDVRISQALLYLRNEYSDDIDKAVELCTKEISSRLAELERAVSALSLHEDLESMMLDWCANVAEIITLRNDLNHGLWLSEAGAFTGVKRQRRGESKPVRFLHQDAERIGGVVNAISSLHLDLPAFLHDNRLREALEAKGFWTFPELDPEMQATMEGAMARILARRPGEEGE